MTEIRFCYGFGAEYGIAWQAAPFGPFEGEESIHGRRFDASVTLCGVPSWSTSAVAGAW
jgi:hypothetical protein